MAITFTNSFEGGTNGTTLTTANTGGASGNAFSAITKNANLSLTFDTAHPAQGSSLGVNFTFTSTGAGYGVVNFATTLGSRTSFRMWMYIVGTSVQYNPRMLEFRDSSLGMPAYMWVRATDGALVLGNGTGQSAFSPTPFPTDQLIFVEGAITTSATAGQGICELTAFAASDLVNPLWSNTKTGTTLNTTAAINTIRLGTSAGATAAYSMWFDDFGVTDTLSSGFMGPVSPPPTANFTATPTTGTIPLAVSFTDTSTGSPTSWAWDFNDGSTSTLQNPSHTYTGTGTYTPKLTATNVYGSTSATQTISPMPSQYVNTFEGGTDATNFPSGTFTATGMTSGTPFDIVLRNSGMSIMWSSSVVWNGSLAAQYNYADSTAGYLGWNTTVPTATTRVTAKLYVNLGTVQSGTTGDQMLLFYNSGGQVALIGVSSANGFITTPTGGSYTPPRNTWLRIEAGCKPGTTTSNGTFDWAIYVGDSTTAAASGSASNLNLGTTAITQVRFGSTAGFGVRTNYYDNVALSTVLTTGFIGVVSAPTASYTVSSTSGTLPMTTSFTDTSTGTPVAWWWDFGDGTTSSSTNPTHTYTANGSYTVTQTAINSGGNSNSTNAGQITAVGTITVSNTFEGGTNGTTVTTANSGGASGTAFTSIAAAGSAALTFSNYSPAQASTLGMKVSYPGTNSAGYAVMTVNAALGSRVSFRLWGSVASSTISAKPRFLEFRDPSNTVMGLLQFQNDGTIYLGDNTTNGGCISPFPAPLDQLFFMQGALTTSGTTAKAKWEFAAYNANDLATPLWSLTAPNSTTGTSTSALGSIRLGSSGQSTAANDVYFDDFLATDTLITGFPPPRIPQVALPYVDTWTGANGASWPSTWVTGTSAGSGGSTAIQSNDGRMTVGTTSTSWMKAFLPATKALSDTELSVSFTVATQVVSNFNFQICADPTQYTNNAGEMPNNGYTLNFNVDTSAANGSYDMWRMSGGGPTQLTSTTNLALAAGIQYRIRFQRIAGLIRFKYWATSGAEPSTWTASYTDASPLPVGRVAMTVGNAVGQYIDYDDMVVLIPTAGKAKPYVSGSFTAKPVKVWNGTTWVAKLMKTWNGSSWVLVAGTPSTTFTDTFTRADASTPGNGWTPVTGTWNISSNRLLINNTSAGALVVQNNTFPGGANQFAQMTVVNTTSISGSSVSVLCRVSPDNQSFYAFRQNSSTTVQLYKSVSGTLTGLGVAQTYTMANGDTMRIEARGTQIVGYINGVAIQTATDSSVTATSLYGTGIRTFANSNGILISLFSCGIF